MEIGGYFEFENLIHNEYYPELIALNTARNAVAYLIETKNIKKLFIPTFLCDSIFKLCEREGCEYEFYEVGSDFYPIFDRPLLDNEWIYIVNYYGQINNEVELKNKYKRIVFDNVQAFFQKPSNGIDTLYSCRKFFGVPDGAYLASDHKIVLEQDISKDRMKHILGRYEKTAQKYYDSYVENEESYVNLPVRKMSKITHNILGAIDYESVKKKRNENFQYLYDRLQRSNLINVRKVEGAFAFPFYCKSGLEIKKKLVSKGIFIATLWPTAIEFGGLAKDYSENILPLPCDQRYSIDDMKVMVDEVVKLLGCINS